MTKTIPPPLALRDFDQVVETLRSWGFDVSDVHGRSARVTFHDGEGTYRTILTPNSAVGDIGDYERAFRNLLSAETTRFLCTTEHQKMLARDKKLASARADDLARGIAILVHYGAAAMQHPDLKRGLAVLLARVLRDPYPDVADALEVHAGSFKLFPAPKPSCVHDGGTVLRGDYAGSYDGQLHSHDLVCAKCGALIQAAKPCPNCDGDGEVNTHDENGYPVGVAGCDACGGTGAAPRVKGMKGGPIIVDEPHEEVMIKAGDVTYRIPVPANATPQQIVDAINTVSAPAFVARVKNGVIGISDGSMAGNMTLTLPEVKP